MNYYKIQIELETYKKELEKENLELKEFFNENNNLKCENNNIFFNFEKKKKIKNLEKDNKILNEQAKEERLKVESLVVEQEVIHKQNLELIQNKLEDVFKRESEFNKIKKRNVK